MEPALRALAPQAVVRRCVSGSFAWQRRAGVFLIPMISGTMPPVCALSVLGFSRPPAGVRLLSAHPGGALRKLLRLVPSSAQLFVLLRSLGRPERGNPFPVKLRATRTDPPPVCARPSGGSHPAPAGSVGVARGLPRKTDVAERTWGPSMLKKEEATFGAHL